MKKDKKLKLCAVCGQPFNWFDNVIESEDNDKIFHKDCVELFPIEWSVFDGEDYLCTTESDSKMAMDLLDIGEYKEGSYE